MFVVVSFCASGQTTCHPSARAIFLGQTGAIPPSAAEQPANCREKAKVEAPKPTSVKKKVSVPASAKRRQEADSDATIVKVSNPVSFADLPNMSAMMFWIELVKSNGEKQRVTTDRIFHSGETFQLHVESSVTGRLLVYQRDSDGSKQLLFPDQAVYAGDNLVQAKVETIVPSAGKIKFDNRPGTETLYMVLTPGDRRPTEQQVTAGAGPVQEQVQTADRNIETASTRGLVLEADNQRGKEAEYVASTGPITVEIKLRHQ
jgi:hypothetical protein